MEFYIVILLGFYTWAMVHYMFEDKVYQAIGTGINVLIWSPFVGRALGWW